MVVGKVNVNHQGFVESISYVQAKCVSVCLVLCVCRGSKYSEVVPDWLILNSDLYGTIHNCGPLRTQFDDVVVLAVVFFALFSRNIGFQMFGNLKDIPLI